VPDHGFVSAACPDRLALRFEIDAGAADGESGQQDQDESDRSAIHAIALVQQFVDASGREKIASNRSWPITFWSSADVAVGTGRMEGALGEGTAGGRRAMRIVILGGAGAIGREIARDLAGDAGVRDLIVADRDQEGARRVARSIDRPGVHAASIDVSDRPVVVRLLDQADAVVNAVQYTFNVEVMTACLEAGTNYLDLGGLFHMTRRQLGLDDDFRRAGLLAILGIGSCPGVANVQARLLAERFDELHSLRIYNGSTTDRSDSLAWSYSIQTILDEMSTPAVVFRDGEFREAPPLGEEETYRFHDPIGATRVHLSLHSEVATLPLSFADRGLRECVFKISRFGYSEAAFGRLRCLVDLGFASTSMVEAGGVAVRPRDVLIEILKRSGGAAPGGNPGFKEIVTEARGRRSGRPAMSSARTSAWPPAGRTISGGTLLVAAPAAIVARRMAVGAIAATGVRAPEQVIDPAPFFAQLEERGARTTVSDGDPAGP
jgi:saccharopine dehydrogenase (NAD+, L-lysine-forming)